MAETVETVVVSVGGSNIVPKSGIDTDFLAAFRACITAQLETTNRRFILITGGGKTARDYQEAMRRLSGANSTALDKIGIEATRMNALLMLTTFNFTVPGRELYQQVLTDPEEIFDIPRDARIIIAGGFRPGASTDLGAVILALRAKTHSGRTRVVNLTNTNHVHTADPKTNPDAKAITHMLWSEFRGLIPAEWAPGLSSPFDPIAANLADENNVEVACINGARLEDFVSYLDHQPFTGTLLMPNEEE